MSDYRRGDDGRWYDEEGRVPMLWEIARDFFGDKGVQGLLGGAIFILTGIALFVFGTVLL